MDKALSRIQIPYSYRLHKLWRGFGFEPTVTLTVLKNNNHALKALFFHICSTSWCWQAVLCTHHTHTPHISIQQKQNIWGRRWIEPWPSLSSRAAPPPPLFLWLTLSLPGWVAWAEWTNGHVIFGDIDLLFRDGALLLSRQGDKQNGLQEEISLKHIF